MKKKERSLFLVLLITFLFCSEAALADRIFINEIINFKESNHLLLQEVNRISPGMSNTLKYLLFGVGFLILVLLIIIIYRVVKSKKQPFSQVSVVTSSSPGKSYSDQEETRKIPPSQTEDSPSPDKAPVFMNLGAELVVQSGENQGKQFVLNKQETTIGRTGARKNDVELMDDTVSKQQAAIFYDKVNKQFYIRNESTTNQTKVNNRIITEPVVLHFDDMIQMGKTVVVFKKT